MFKYDIQWVETGCWFSVRDKEVIRISASWMVSCEMIKDSPIYYNNLDLLTLHATNKTFWSEARTHLVPTNVSARSAYESTFKTTAMKIDKTYLTKCWSLKTDVPGVGIRSRIPCGSQDQYQHKINMVPTCCINTILIPYLGDNMDQYWHAGSNVGVSINGGTQKQWVSILKLSNDLDYLGVPPAGNHHNRVAENGLCPQNSNEDWENDDGKPVNLGIWVPYFQTKTNILDLGKL